MTKTPDESYISSQALNILHSNFEIIYTIDTDLMIVSFDIVEIDLNKVSTYTVDVNLKKIFMYTIYVRLINEDLFKVYI